jgi:hypothetical protein
MGHRMPDQYDMRLDMAGHKAIENVVDKGMWRILLDGAGQLHHQTTNLRVGRSNRSGRASFLIYQLLMNYRHRLGNIDVRGTSRIDTLTGLNEVGQRSEW